MNNEFESKSKYAVVAHKKRLSRNSSGGTEGNNENPEGE
jgi:hypothetical protein